MRMLTRSLPLALGILLAVALPAWGQNAVTRPMLQNPAFDPNIQGDWIFSGTLMVPNGSAPSSAACDEATEAGRIFVDIDEASGQQWYVCEGTAGWVLQGGTGITGGPSCGDSRVLCVGKDANAEYSTICGMTVGSGGANSCGDAADTCAAGSALVAAAALSPDPNQPVTILVGPGVYNECVHFDNITDVTLRGSGMYSTYIYPGPTLTDYSTDINGGVLRFAEATATRASTARITVSDLTVRGNAWSAPEACVQLGLEGGPGAGSPAPWQDIHITRVRGVCPHDAYQEFGSRLTTDDDLPRSIVTDSIWIGGDAMAKKGWTRSTWVDNVVYNSTNASEYSDPNYLAARSGYDVASVTDGDTFNIDPNDAAPAGFSYAGRRITLTDSDGGGAGECGTANAAEGTYWIWDNSDAADTISVDPDPNTTVTTGCAYQIEAVTHDNGEAYAASDVVDSLFTDFDWSVTRDSIAGPAAFWKNTWVHFGTGNTSTPVPDSDSLHVQNLTGATYINDFGVGGTGNCGGQNHVVGILGYFSAFQYAWFYNVSGSLHINNDMQSGGTCTIPVKGIALTGIGKFEDRMVVDTAAFRIENPGDANVNTACVDSSSTTASAGDLRVNNVSCDVLNTAGGYSGTYTTLAQSGNSTLTAGRVSSAQAITTSGTIGHLAEFAGGFSGTLTQDIADPSGACLESNAITVTGAALGDVCLLGTSAALPSGVNGTCHVTAGDTVKVSLCGTGDPASMTYTVKVMTP